MLDWIKLGHKNYPEFWTDYLSNFDKKTNRVVVLKIHTSGTNADQDSIISLAAVAIIDNTIAIGDSFEAVIAHRKNIVDQENNNYLDISIKEKVTEQVAISALVKYLKNATIVGHRVDVDLEFLNAALAKQDCGKLKNEALDLEVMCRKWKDAADNKRYSIFDLRNEFNIEKPQRNDTVEDAFDLALIFLKLKYRLRL